MEVYERLLHNLQNNLDLHGENHISNALFYEKLAISQYSMNDFDEALSYLEKSYELQLSIHGDSNESVLDTDYKIGLLMYKSSKGYSSQYISRHMKRLLASRQVLDESTFSKLNPLFVPPTGDEYLDLMDSSMLYCDEAERQSTLNNFSGAEEAFKRCLQVRQVKFGPSHIAMSMVQSKYASMLLEMGRVHDASSLLEECIATDTAHYGRQHEKVACHLFALSHISRIRDKLNEAITLAQESLSIRRVVLGEGHHLVTQTAQVIVDIQRELESANNNRHVATATRPLNGSQIQQTHHSFTSSMPQLQIETAQTGHVVPAADTIESNDIFSTSMSPLQLIGHVASSVPSHPLATAGSETEDMLCEEIAIDRMYAKLIEDHTTQIRRTGQRSSNNAEEGDGDGDLQHLQTLCSQLGENDEPEEDQLIEKQVLHKIDTLLFRIHGKILSVDDNDSSIHLVLDKVLGIVNMYSPPRLLMYVKYAVNRAHAMAYFKGYNFAMAMKFINPAISGCPQANGYFVGGLADALVLLTGCHSSLGRRDDALHSARLAVNIAHERLDGYNKTHQILTSENPYVLGPTLDPLSAVILTYCTLASELEKSGLGHLSIEWYERAVQAAVKFKMDSSVVLELTKLIDLSRFHLPLASPPAKQKRESGFKTHRSDSENTVSSRPTNNSKDAQRRKRQSEERMRHSDNEADEREDEYRFHHHNSSRGRVMQTTIPPVIDIVPEVDSIDTRERGINRLQRPQSHVQTQSNQQRETTAPLSSTSRTRPHSAMPRLVKYNYSDNGSIEEMHHPYYNNNHAKQQQQQDAVDHPHMSRPQQYSDYGRPVNESQNRDNRPQMQQQQQQQSQRQTYQSVNQEYFQNDTPLIRPQNPKAMGRRTSFDNRISTMHPVSPIGNGSVNHQYNDTLSVESEEEHYSQGGGGGQRQGQGGAVIIGASERVRPKSAVSKLGGGYMSPAVTNTQSNRESQGQQIPQNAHNYNKQREDHTPKYSVADMTRPPPVSTPLQAKPMQVFSQAIILLPSSSSTLSSAQDAPRKKQPSSKVKSRLVNSLSNLQRPVGGFSSPSKRAAATTGVQPRSEKEEEDYNRHRNGVGLDKKSSHRPSTATQGGGGQQQTQQRPTKQAASSGSVRPKSSSGIRQSTPTMTTPLLSSTTAVLSVKPSPLLAVNEFSQQKVSQISQTFFPYIKGMQIEAKYLSARLQGSRTRWYPGRIVAANFAQGLYDVEFDNGEKESDVFVDDIRIPDSINKRFKPLKSSAAMSTTLKKVNNNNKEESISPLPAGVIDFDAPTAKSIRNANMQVMHENILRTFSGVTSRESKRKIARLEYKNAKIIKIQSLARGMSVRLRLPKIRSQILREKDIKTKERALLDKEQLIMQSYQQLLAKNAMSQMSGTGNDSLPDFADLRQHQPLLLEDEPFEGSGTENLYQPAPRPSTNITVANNNNNRAQGVEVESSGETLPRQLPVAEEKYKDRDNQDMAFLKEELLSMQREQARLYELETRRQADMEGKYNLIFEELLLSRKELKRNRKSDNERREAMESQMLRLQALQTEQNAKSNDIFDENGNVKIDDFWMTTDFDGSSDMFSQSVMSPLPTPSHRRGQSSTKDGLYISVDNTPLKDTSSLASLNVSMRSVKADVPAPQLKVATKPVVVTPPVVAVTSKPNRKQVVVSPTNPVVAAQATHEKVFAHVAAPTPVVILKPEPVSAFVAPTPVVISKPEPVSAFVAPTPVVISKPEPVSAFVAPTPVAISKPVSAIVVQEAIVGPVVAVSALDELSSSVVEEAEEMDCGSENPQAVRRLERYMSSTRFDDEELKDLQSEIDSQVRVVIEPPRQIQTASTLTPVQVSVSVQPIPLQALMQQSVTLVLPIEVSSHVSQSVPVVPQKAEPIAQPLRKASSPAAKETSHMFDNDQTALSHRIALDYAEHEDGAQDVGAATFRTVLRGYEDHTIENQSEPLSHFIGVNYNECAQNGISDYDVDFHTVMHGYEDHTIENQSEALSHHIGVNFSECAQNGIENIDVDFHTVMHDYEDHTIENQSEALSHHIGVNFSECAQNGVQDIDVDFHTMLRVEEEEEGEENEEKDVDERNEANDAVKDHENVIDYSKDLANLAIGEHDGDADDEHSPPHTPINIVELHTSPELYDELEDAIASIRPSTPCALTVSSNETQLVTICVGDVEIRPTDIFNKDVTRRSVYLLPDLVESVNAETGKKTYKAVKINLRKMRSSSTDSSPMSTSSTKSRPYELILTHDSLRSLFRSGTWAKLRDGSASPSRKSRDLDKRLDCLIRGSQIKVHTVLKLFVHLWESYVNWTIQGILIQAAITELVCDNVKQIISHAEGEQSPGRRPWQTYFVDLLKAGRELFLTYTSQIDQAQQEIGDELVHWEFDSRRKTDTARRSDDEACPESMLIANMNTIAHSVRDKLTDVSIDLGLIENRLPSHELKMSPRGSNAHRASTRAVAVALNRQQIRRSSSRRSMNEQLNLSITPTSDDIDAMWSDCYEHIGDCVKTMLHSLNLMGEFSAETDDCLQTACRLVFTVGLNQMREFHWRRWWQNRNECIELISQDKLDSIVICAEELMFAANGDVKDVGDSSAFTDMILNAAKSVPSSLVDKYVNRTGSVKSTDSSVVQQECNIS